MDFDRNKYTMPQEVEERKATIRWLHNHPCFIAPIKNDGEKGIDGEPDHREYIPHNMFHDQLYIMWAWVDPNTRQVEDEPSQNTVFEVWLEHGPVHDLTEDDFEPTSKWDRYTCSHDINLDCGAENLEDALIELSFRVRHYYGEYDTEDPLAFITWHKTHKDGVLK